MVTGDSTFTLSSLRMCIYVNFPNIDIVTAENIAKACGILRPGGVCLEGPVFRDMPEAERKAILPRLHVLARSSPTGNLSFPPFAFLQLVLMSF